MPSLHRDLFHKILTKVDKQPYDYNTFIETGTFWGNTTNFISTNYNMEVYTIELSEHYYKQAKLNFANRNNVHPIFGDSAVELKNLVEKLNENNFTIFWLDGHYSGEGTAKGLKDCPLIEECNSIDTLYKADYGLVLIDDYRLFGMKNESEDWSNISFLSISTCFQNHLIKSFIEEDTMIIEIKKK